MNIKDKENRLNKFYGDVARIQNKDIINLITGRRILDVGCGYGTLINQIKKEKDNTDVVGIDVDPESIKIAKDFYNINVKEMSVCKLDFSNNYFDTIILRESIHHFDTPDKLQCAIDEIKRVCNKELIIFDPNPSWLVKFARKLIKHQDPEAPFDKTKRILEKNGFEIKKCEWRDVIAFPLSGGFVGREFVPNIKFLKNTILIIDNVLNAILSRLKVQKHVCWRYIIYAVKPDSRKT